MPSVWLDAGVGGSFGTLEWTDANGSFVTTGNSVPTDDPGGEFLFNDSTGTLVPKSNSAKLPVELVFQAVAEVVRTSRRPTCVDWMAAAY